MESSQFNLSVIAGIVLSLIFEYIPGVAPWYDSLDMRKKQGVMALALLVVSLAIFGLSCANLIQVGITCDWVGAQELLGMFIAALVANQSTYLIVRKE